MPTAPTSGVVNKKRIEAQKSKKPYGQTKTKKKVEKKKK